MEQFSAYTSIILKGIAAAPGLAEGPALVWQKERLEIPRHPINNPKQQISRLEKAIESSQCEIEALREQLIKEKHQPEAAVFDAHIMMLRDSSLFAKVNEILANQSLNIEAAWYDAIQFYAEQLSCIPDPTLQARAADIRDIGDRVLNHLLGKRGTAMLKMTRPSVVIARDLAPSETVAMDKSMALAFCTAEGGPTSHTAILAKALGIPAIVSLGEKVLALSDGCSLLVDGSEGTLIAYPDERMQADFNEKRFLDMQISAEEIKIAHEPAITLDGHQVEIVANIGKPEEAIIALQNGAEGVGLLRTEFLFLERQTAPDEQEQFQEYQKILDIMQDRPVVVRTIDVGGDKEIPYLDLGHESNPFLGWRAIRMCLDQPEFFKTQLRALLRASIGHNMRIMFPMISTLTEVRQAKVLIDEAKCEVTQAHYEISPNIQLGIMVETPSVAILADKFAKEVDFFSIGTNDLTQYTLAAERTNPKLCHLGDACHPAVLRQIKSVIEIGHQAGIWVGVCGELAGDADAIPILLGMGLDEFSISPKAIPHAKSIIRQWRIKNAEQLAIAVVNCDSADAVRELVHNFQAGAT